MNVNLDLSILYVLICFFIIFFVAKNTLLKRLDEILGNRREMIQGSMEKASDNDELIEEKLSTIDAKLAEAREKAYNQRVERREEALGEQGEIVEEARRESSQQLEKNQEELDDSVADARETLRKESEGYARSIADTILRRSA